MGLPEPITTGVALGQSGIITESTLWHIELGEGLKSVAHRISQSPGKLARVWSWVWGCSSLGCHNFRCSELVHHVIGWELVCHVMFTSSVGLCGWVGVGVHQVHIITSEFHHVVWGWSSSSNCGLEYTGVHSRLGKVGFEVSQSLFSVSLTLTGYTFHKFWAQAS